MRSNGVIRVLNQGDRSYYTSGDVQRILGVGRSLAYKMIKTTRQELIDSGAMSDLYPQGKIPKSYFNKRFCIPEGGRNEKKEA